jgi:hypothetical protein
MIAHTPPVHTRKNPQPTAVEIHRFFELLYPNVDDGWMVLSHPDPAQLTPQGKPPWLQDWFNLTTTPWQKIARAGQILAQKYSVYFGVALQRPTCAPGQFKRSRNSTAYIVPGFWFDLDLAYGHHAASTLPTTDADALDFLGTLPAPPSLIVHSGGGLYGYWLFKEPYVIATEDEHQAMTQLAKQFTHTLTTAGKDRGWTFDALGDLARVLRPPGTINHKYGKLVEVLHESGIRYNPSEFDWLLELPTPARTVHNGAVITGQPDLVAIAEHYGTAFERKSQSELAGPHPHHGSSTGDNFNINPDKGLWHCWRCGTGGDALALIAVCEGVIACGQATSGMLRGDLFKRVVTIANDKFHAGIHLTATGQDTHQRQQEEQRGACTDRELSSITLSSLSSLSSQPTFPKISAEAFYGLAGELRTLLSRHTEADDVALLVQFLTYFGVMIGRTAYHQVEATKHYTNLYGCLVGATSRARKGTSYDQIEHLMTTVDTSWTLNNISGGCGSGEGLIAAVRDAIVKREPIKERGRVVGYQDVEVDPGVIDKRLLVQEAEFASVLKIAGREGNTLSMILRQAWDSGNLRNTVKNNPLIATGAHIAVVGHITQEELRRHLSTTDMANGFANRFLWLCVKRSKLLPEGGALHTVDFAPFLKCLKEAVVAAKTVGKMQRDAEATVAWRAIYATLSADRPGLLGAMTARAEAQVLRLSCLYALLDGSSTITVEHLYAALALWEYAEASVTYVFGDTTGDPTVDVLLAALRQCYPEGLTRWQISDDVFARHRRADDIARALRFLAEKGAIEIRRSPSTGGRPSETIFYRPECEESEESEESPPRYLPLAQEAVQEYRQGKEEGVL